MTIEIWMVNGELVASQPSYTHAYLKEGVRETKHYYCSRCGQVWGLRVCPNANEPSHYYYRKRCPEHGGSPFEMLTPWEQENLDVLSPNVLAFLILSTDPKEDLSCV